jgi:hypothetical protein
MWRSTTIANQTEQILFKVRWDVIMIKQFGGHRILVKAIIEYVQRRVVSISVHVRKEMFEFHLYGIPAVILTTFKLPLTQLFICK